MQQIIKRVIDNRLKIGKILFFIAYTIMMFFWMFTDVKYVSSINKYLIKISYLIIVLSSIFQFSKKDIKDKKNIFFLIAFICSAIAWIISDSSTLAILILFIIAARNIEFDSIVRYDIKIRIAFTIVIILFYVIGFTDNYIMYREDGTIRSSMGFSHPNTFAIHVFLICAEFIYLRYKIITWKDYVLVIAISFLVDFLSDSRASQIAIFLLLAGTFLCKITKSKILENVVIKNLIPYLFILFTILSLILCIFYNSDNFIMEKIDDILSGRIRLAKEFLEEFKITPFGNNLELIGEENAKEKDVEPRVLDNAYINIILQYGIINYIILAFIMYKILKISLKEKNYIFCIIMCVYIIRGMTGNGSYSLQTNTFLLYFSHLMIFKNNKNEILQGELNE